MSEAATGSEDQCGTWGETQFGNLLAQVFAPEQYLVNQATIPGSSERIEFAIRLPAGVPIAPPPSTKSLLDVGRNEARRKF